MTSKIETLIEDKTILIIVGIIIIILLIWYFFIKKSPLIDKKTRVPIDQSILPYSTEKSSKLAFIKESFLLDPSYYSNQKAPLTKVNINKPDVFQTDLNTVNSDLGEFKNIFLMGDLKTVTAILEKYLNMGNYVLSYFAGIYEAQFGENLAAKLADVYGGLTASSDLDSLYTYLYNYHKKMGKFELTDTDVSSDTEQPADVA